jgi:hypothetical protein
VQVTDSHGTNGGAGARVVGTGGAGVGVVGDGLASGGDVGHVSIHGKAGGRDGVPGGMATCPFASAEFCSCSARPSHLARSSSSKAAMTIFRASLMRAKPTRVERSDN